MGYINVFVANSCKISTHHNSLVLKGESERSYILSDINSIMIESRECTITTYTLGELAKANIAVFVCDEKHMPVAIITPFNTYIRQLETYNIQQNATKPTIKKLWQNIVQQKIKNEATCLDLLNRTGSEELESIASRIYSGDTNNGEAHAAKLYFSRLFGRDFSRTQDNCINAALNYTYAIVRGIIARSLVVYGFTPYIALHHCNLLNNYNLADDIIEPFRAICDYYVLSVIDDEVELTTILKARLYSIVNVEVLVDNEKHSLSNAVERFISSLKDSMSSNTSRLSMPILIGANIHRYE